ncbi:GNAT family N-acetyltransferase [Algibacter sp.]|nr:GNAT family N-acetyltransferase [Algibacter sp.]MDA9069379.1 GNAT family N-acetyltransferase [Algibacter sp.]MDA9344194.1 GNAT family N-acetyltransferase [Algibacter sp.]MDA9774949.1 GNAT family N-acetyltransferase [Algibacter sp.]MDC1227204.1 GNAT family N-acetyltransferase [Algibacter sp.]MDC1365147.1 GNAT family N-acetyltransferase [Algibacter sp.]
MIRPVHINDAQELLEMYNYYVINTTVNFDIEPLSLKTFTDKLNIITADYPFIVLEENNEILGYAYGSRFRPRAAYNYVAESTVYVKHTAHGKQIGSKLYTELIRLLKETDLHTVLGVLTIPNEASIKLHEKFGFEQVANLKEVGLKFGEWQNVGIWQLKLD